MADDALIAHYLRRLTFGPHPGRIEELAASGAPAALEALLDPSPLPYDEPGLGTDDDYGVMRRWYLSLLRQREAGLHERMVWFWHGLLTSSLHKAEPLMMFRQQVTLRDHALGNFRDLLQAITIDGAMLAWLDGSGSRWEAPNENYARELMELFSLGKGNYSEDDVRAGAKALSGYWIDYEDSLTVMFDDESGPQGSVSFLGVDVDSAEAAINAVCDHEACAPHIAAQIFEYFVGRQPDPDERARFGSIMRDNDLDIRATVEAIVRDSVFNTVPTLESMRPRSPIEWFLAAEALLDVELDEWVLRLFGQVPMEPPNVAGWPGGRRWLSTSAALTRAQFGYDMAFDTAVEDDDPVAAVLARAGLLNVSESTAGALRQAVDSLESRRDKASVAHALVLSSPEFALS